MPDPTTTDTTRIREQQAEGGRIGAQRRWDAYRAHIEATQPVRDAATTALDAVILTNPLDLAVWRAKAHVALGCRCAGDLAVHA